MKLIAHKDNDANTGPFSDDNTSMEGAKRIGLTLFALVFGFFGLWAGIAPLDGAAFAPGTVTVKSYKKTVQHLEGGIVSDILVEEGELVTTGQPLLTLDATQAGASLEVANSQYIALKKARVATDRRARRAGAVAYPTSLSRADDRVREEIAAQNEILQARKDAQ